MILSPTSIGVLLLVLLAVVAMQRARHLAQPLRLKMAATGEELLADSKMPEAAKAQVRFYLDRAFGMRLELLVSYVVVIFYSPRLLLSDENSDHLCDGAPEKLRQKFDGFCSDFMRVMFANNPVMAFLLILEMLVLMLLFAPVVIFVKKALPTVPSVWWVLKRVSQRPHVGLPHIPAFG